MNIQHDVAALCEDAVRRIEAEGWAQGITGAATGKTCLWLALNDAGLIRRNVYAVGSVDRMHWNQAGEQAMAMVATAIPVPFVEEHNLAKLGSSTILIQWNDSPGRTVDEVLSVLRRVREAALKDAESP